MSKVHSVFKTPKGTEIPLLDLKGKPYMQAADRLIWFREEMPFATIETIPYKIEDNYAIFVTKISNEGKLLATATKKETSAGFPDFVEKAETGSCSRALAMCGFGTQFAREELDEKDRLADSPVLTLPKKADTVTMTPTAKPNPTSNGFKPKSVKPNPVGEWS